MKDKFNLDFELLIFDFEGDIKGVNCRICVSALLKLQSLKYTKLFGHLTVFTSLLQCHETAYLAAIVLMKEFLAWPITL